MDSLAPSRIWVMRLCYAGLAMVILFFHLLPLDSLPRGWAAPDLLLALTLAWALRRPDFVPPVLIAIVILLADLLLQRPPGLLAALTVAGAAFLHSRFGGHGETGFVAEWLAVAVVLIAIALLYRIVLAITSVDQAPLFLMASQLLLTILIYPLVAGSSQAVFGVRRLTPADAEALGAR